MHRIISVLFVKKQIQQRIIQEEKKCKVLYNMDKCRGNLWANRNFLKSKDLCLSEFKVIKYPHTFDKIFTCLRIYRVDLL